MYVEYIGIIMMKYKTCGGAWRYTKGCGVRYLAESFGPLGDDDACTAMFLTAGRPVSCTRYM